MTDSPSFPPPPPPPHCQSGSCMVWRTHSRPPSRGFFESSPQKRRERDRSLGTGQSRGVRGKELGVVWNVSEYSNPRRCTRVLVNVSSPGCLCLTQKKRWANRPRKISQLDLTIRYTVSVCLPKHSPAIKYLLFHLLKFKEVLTLFERAEIFCGPAAASISSLIRRILLSLD